MRMKPLVGWIHATAPFMVGSVLLATGAAVAQTYPAKPIRFVSPQPPGGTFDYAMRVFAERLLPVVLP